MQVAFFSNCDCDCVTASPSLHPTSLSKARHYSVWLCSQFTRYSFSVARVKAVYSLSLIHI